MTSRSQRAPKERDARSRAVKRVAKQPLIRGSVVPMHRKCGKKGCHCEKGEKHPALYLALRDEGKRRMIYIPPELEETVRVWVRTARDVDELLDLISESCYQDFQRKKSQVLQGPRKARRTSKGDATP